MTLLRNAVDKNKVDKEIYRLLKPSGNFIAVDSLNNNPVYKLDRYIKKHNAKDKFNLNSSVNSVKESR